MIDETFAQLLINAQGCVLVVGNTSDKLKIFNNTVRVPDDALIYVFRRPNGENASAFVAIQLEARPNFKEDLVFVSSYKNDHTTEYTFRWAEELDRLWWSYDPLEKNILYPLMPPDMRRAFPYASWRRFSHSQVGVASFLDVVYHNFGDDAVDDFAELLREDAYVNVPFVELPAKDVERLQVNMLALKCIRRGCSPHISKRQILHNPGIGGNVQVPFYQAADLSAVRKVVSEQLEVMKR